MLFIASVVAILIRCGCDVLVVDRHVPRAVRSPPPWQWPQYRVYPRETARAPNVSVRVAAGANVTLRADESAVSPLGSERARSLAYGIISAERR